MSGKSNILPNDYLTNITKIDEQHQHMACLLETLCQIAIESHIENRLDHRINELLLALVETTRDHFNTEQELMLRYQYAGSRKHCEEHATLLKEVNSIKEYCEAGDMVLTYRILRRLIDEWFLKHIIEMDKDLGRYLCGKERV
jgi:hemerythrin